MNDPDSEIQAAIRDEKDRVRPPSGAKERGWARLVAAVPDDSGDPGDGGGPGGSSPPATLKVMPLLKALPLAVLLVVGATIVWGSSAPAIVENTLELGTEPAVVHGAPIAVPFAQKPLVTPVAAPEYPTAARANSRPRPSEIDESDDSSFAGELSLLAEGQAAIQRGSLREGLALLRSHKQRFPRGHFAQERDALIAIARCEGERAGARNAGQMFLQANADSIHAERVRRACEL